MIIFQAECVSAKLHCRSPHAEHQALTGRPYRDLFSTAKIADHAHSCNMQRGCVITGIKRLAYLLLP